MTPHCIGTYNDFRLTSRSIAYSFSVKSVEMNGITYKAQALVAIHPAKDNEEPLFGLIKEIFVAGHCVHFYLQELKTREYDEHFCVYVLSPTASFKLMNYESISSHLPLSSHKLEAFPGHLCAIPKFIII